MHSFIHSYIIKLNAYYINKINYYKTAEHK